MSKIEKYKKEHETKRALFRTVANETNWKFPTRSKRCRSHADAERLADAITYFVGGAEINGTTVSSRGYYHYIGA